MEKKMLARHPLGNPRRRWKQEQFILSLVNPGPMGLEKEGPFHCAKARRAVKVAVEAGFNLMEMCWTSHDVGMEILRTAEELGTKVLYQDLKRFGGMGFKKTPLNEHNDLLGAMRDTAQYGCIMGYYMYDEPCTPEQRATVRKMIEDAERERPELLPFTVTTASQSNELAEEVDPAQLSFDQYPFGGWVGDGMTPETQMDGCSKYWTNMEVARLAADRIGAPYWFVYQGHVLPYNPCFDGYTFAASRMMANTALLYGVKELSCYIECNGVLDPETGDRGLYFEEQRDLNRRITALGNTLMALHCDRVIHGGNITPYKERATFATMEESELLVGNLPDRISISEMSDDYGNRYLMVANRDYREVTSYFLKMKQDCRVYRVSDEDGEQHLVFDDPGNKIVGNLLPGHMALYRLQPKSEEPFELGYYLEK